MSISAKARKAIFMKSPEGQAWLANKQAAADTSTALPAEGVSLEVNPAATPHRPIKPIVANWFYGAGWQSDIIVDDSGSLYLRAVVSADDLSIGQFEQRTENAEDRTEEVWKRSNPCVVWSDPQGRIVATRVPDFTLIDPVLHVPGLKDAFDALPSAIEADPASFAAYIEGYEFRRSEAA